MSTQGRISALIASLFLTWTGAAMTSVGAALLLVDRFGLGVQAGTALAVQVLPNVLLGPFVGDLVSRRAPRMLAIGSSLLAALLVLAYPVVRTPGQAQLVALLTGLAVLPGIPARMALRSALVPLAAQHRFSGQVVAAERLALVAGPLAAGLLAARLGYPAVFYGEAVLAAGAALLLLRTPDAPFPAAALPSLGWRGPYLRAAALLRGSRLLSAYTVTAATYSIGIGMRRLALPALAVLLTGSAGPELGVLTAALAAGGAAGGLLLGRWPPGRPERWYLRLSVLEGAGWALLLLVPGIPGTTLVLGAIGAGEGAATALFFSRVQELVPAAEIGRYFAVLSPVTDAAVVAGLLLAGSFGGPQLGRWGLLAIAVLVAAPVVGTPALVRAARELRPDGRLPGPVPGQPVPQPGPDGGPLGVGDREDDGVPQ